jgi:phage recombination protein Bet
VSGGEERAAYPRVTDPAALTPPEPSNDRGLDLALLRLTICPTLTDAEFALFAEVCRRSKLDPFRRQIYAVKRDTKRGPVVTHQTSIDGFRVIAERSDKYEGQAPPLWCGADGAWRDVWLEKTPPSAAKIGVYRTGFREAIVAVARFSSYVVTGFGDMLWQKMPDVMIAKCAESLALRKAFPEDLSGLYTSEEMGQAGRIEVPELEPFVTPSQEVIDQMRAELLAAETERDLRSVMASIARNHYAPECLVGLREVARERRESFRAIADEGTP